MEVNRTQPTIMRLFTLSLSPLLLAASLTWGQDTKPADPFIKTKPDTEAKPAANASTPPTASALEAPPLSPKYPVFIMETYTLPKESLDELHTEAPPAAEFYERIRKLTTEGKATMDSVSALPTKSGQRAINESVDEVLYPIEFDPPVEGRTYSFPTAFEQRPVGERVEIDPVLSEDEKLVHLNLAPEITRLNGFVEQKAGASSGGELVPLFSTRKVTTSVTCTTGVPFLLGTQNRPGGTGLADAEGAADMVSVSFITPRLVEVPAGPKHADVDNSTLRMVFRAYSLPRAVARDLLATTTDADALHTRMLAQPKDTVKLQRILTLHTRSGQRATLEEVAENIYSTEFSPPTPPLVRDAIPEVKTATGTTPRVPPVYASGKDALPASTKSLEMRPLGWRVEVDVVASPDGSVTDLNFSFEHTENRGPLQGPPLMNRYPSRPVFASQKITTALTASTGRQCFLGTLNPPQDTGVNERKDDGQVWFAFVKVTLE